MEQKVRPFFLFSGIAEEAMNYYASTFKETEIVTIIRYGPEEPGEEGTVLEAVFSLKGQEIMCVDSSVEHQFAFTPAISMFVTCDSEAEINNTYAKLSKDGEILMPLAEYPHNKRYAWVADKYGITWQLNLATK